MSLKTLAPVTAVVAVAGLSIGLIKSQPVLVTMTDKRNPHGAQWVKQPRNSCATPMLTSRAQDMLDAMAPEFQPAPGAFCRTVYTEIRPARILPGKPCTDPIREPTKESYRVPVMAKVMTESAGIAYANCVTTGGFFYWASIIRGAF